MRAAIGRAGRDVRDRPANCPRGDRTKRSTGGANYNVIGVTDLGGNLIERYVLQPYGELTVHQLSSYGDRDGDGDGDVDATDKGTPGVTCTGTVTGACRILDLDFDSRMAEISCADGRSSSRLGRHLSEGSFGQWETHRFVSHDGTFFAAWPPQS